MKNIDRIRGCLIGGAAGDALGYAVEFIKDDEIFRRYGASGITKYELINGVAQISDDTQMTLYTANGLLLADTDGTKAYLPRIHAGYRDWLLTQNDGGQPAVSWLNNIPEMNDSRAPGVTCMSALYSGKLHTIEKHINKSKGCGGVMRVAPIGLYFEDKGWSAEEIDMLGAQAAALTHGHELGYIPSAMLVHIVHLLAHHPEMKVRAAVEDAKSAMLRLFPHAQHLRRMIQLTDDALRYAVEESADDLDAIRELGEGWVAEETLAIAIYCAVKYHDHFEKGIVAAVNHSGDSDSTGAVTGNILGAHLGMQGIPEKFITNLELKETILEIADDLYHGVPEPDSERESAWKRKYVTHSYPMA